MKLKSILTLSLLFTTAAFAGTTTTKANRTIAADDKMCGQLRGRCLGENMPGKKAGSGCFYSVSDGTTGTPVHPGTPAVLASFQQLVEDWVCVTGEKQNDGFKVNTIEKNDAVKFNGDSQQ